MYLAKVLDRFWPDSGNPDHDGDVGHGVQARWTQYRNGHLLLHPEDNDDHIFVLVIGDLDHYEIRGWLRARDGKDYERYWDKVRRPDRPCFWVPQRDIHQFLPGVGEVKRRIEVLELKLELHDYQLGELVAAHNGRRQATAA